MILIKTNSEVLNLMTQQQLNYLFNYKIFIIQIENLMAKQLFKLGEFYV